MHIRRFPANPIIRPHLDDRMGDNINGPPLIRVPDWIEEPLGRYYLYFAHHNGRYIRLAYSHELQGPWTSHREGVLPLREALFAGHVASPDVHVDHAQRQIRLYYHGSDTPSGRSGKQTTRVALSADGLHFTARPEHLGRPYFRVFHWDGYDYALAMPSVFYRSHNGLSDFAEGPTLFTRHMRHTALKLDGPILSVFYTNAGACPERILLSTIDLTPDWRSWVASAPVVVLEPELDYEGGNLPRVPSVRGLVVLGAGAYNFFSWYPYVGPLSGINANIEQEAGTSAEAFRARSAIYHVDKIKAPILLLHGAHDERIPVRQAKAFYETLQA